MESMKLESVVNSRTMKGHPKTIPPKTIGAGFEVPPHAGFVRCAAPALFHVPVREVRRARTAVRNDSDADVI